MSKAVVRVNLSMFSEELLNALVDSIEQISRIEKEKSLIQDRIVRNKGTVADDNIPLDDEIVSKTVSIVPAEFEVKYFNSTRNSNVEDIKPKHTSEAFQPLVFRHPMKNFSLLSRLQIL